MNTNEDWATKKEQKKDDRYSAHLGFINHLSRRELKDETLGVKNINMREAIWNRTVQKSLSMSDLILKFFFIALNSKIECTLQSLPTEITNKSMGKYNLYLQAMGPP